MEVQNVVVYKLPAQKDILVKCVHVGCTDRHYYEAKWSRDSLRVHSHASKTILIRVLTLSSVSKFSILVFLKNITIKHILVQRFELIYNSCCNNPHEKMSSQVFSKIFFSLLWVGLVWKGFFYTLTGGCRSGIASMYVDIYLLSRTTRRFSNSIFLVLWCLTTKSFRHFLTLNGQPKLGLSNNHTFVTVINKITQANLCLKRMTNKPQTYADSLSTLTLPLWARSV